MHTKVVEALGTKGAEVEFNINVRALTFELIRIYRCIYVYTNSYINVQDCTYKLVQVRMYKLVH